MKDYVFDSFAMIAYFEDESGANLVEQALRELFSKQARGWMSVINCGELYYCTCRRPTGFCFSLPLTLLRSLKPTG